MTSFDKALHDYQARINGVLDKILPASDVIPGRLHEAMRYATLGAGKRVRPFLAYATAETLGIEASDVDACAAAVELIHAYSLVHDDLPAMDDDDLRRGRPTCHKAFDDATAILAGDALQTAAFQALTRPESVRCSDANRLKMLDILASASGSRGMAGGQAIDLHAVGKAITIAELEDMHIHKTGALIRASVLLPTYAKDNVDHADREALDHYAKCIGLAFQIRDDILDIEGSTEELGKPQGADIARDKPTYPALIGLSESKERAQMLHREAASSLERFGSRGKLLAHLSAYIVERSN